MAFPWLATGEGPPNKGKALPEAQRRKQSETRKRMAAEGWKPGNYGKTMTYSPEHIAKLRENLRKAAAAVRKYRPGDRFPDKCHGYVFVYAPGHPSANSVGYVHEHRLIAEKALGRRLKKGEVVHHINGRKDDNRNRNLLICDLAYHRWLHNRMSALYQEAMFGDK